MTVEMIHSVVIFFEMIQCSDLFSACSDLFARILFFLFLIKFSTEEGVLPYLKRVTAIDKYYLELELELETLYIASFPLAPW